MKHHAASVAVWHVISMMQFQLELNEIEPHGPHLDVVATSFDTNTTAVSLSFTHFPETFIIIHGFLQDHKD